MLSASSHSVTSPATLEDSAPVLKGQPANNKHQEDFLVQGHRADKKQDSDVVSEATVFCASLFHSLPWSLEDISPDEVSEGQHLLWLIVLWPSVLTRGYQSRWVQWRPTCATVHCTMTFHTRVEDSRAQTWSAKANSAVANCSVTFCGH